MSRSRLSLMFGLLFATWVVFVISTVHDMRSAALETSLVKNNITRITPDLHDCSIRVCLKRIDSNGIVKANYASFAGLHNLTFVTDKNVTCLMREDNKVGVCYDRLTEDEDLHLTDCYPGLRSIIILLFIMALSIASLFY